MSDHFSKHTHYFYTRRLRAKLGKHIQKAMHERRLSVKDTATIIGAITGAVCRLTSGRHLPQHNKDMNKT